MSQLLSQKPWCHPWFSSPLMFCIWSNHKALGSVLEIYPNYTTALPPPLLQSWSNPPSSPFLDDVLVSVLQRNKTNRLCVYTEREREIYFKELARPAGWKPKEGLQSESKGTWQNSFLFQEVSVCSSQVFNWFDEAHSQFRRLSALLKIHQLKC